MLLQKVVGIRFKKAGQIYYYKPGFLQLEVGDHVVAETDRGLEYGTVVVGEKEIEPSEGQPLRVVQRKAWESDAQRLEDNRRREEEAFRVCAEKIAEHKLPMKLVNVEYTFDLGRIVFYFTSENRVDFRELVKDLALVFKTRIELRQIGVRDQARLLGCIGYCGRNLCCASFLGDFEPVSIRSAKNQNVAINPTKISGICGRLMCCLKFEPEDDYKECPMRSTLKPPTVGSRVVSPGGEGRVVAVNPSRRNATLLMDDGKTVVESWTDLTEQETDAAESTFTPAPKPRERREYRENQGGRPIKRATQPHPERGERTGPRPPRRRRDMEQSGGKIPRSKRPPRFDRNKKFDRRRDDR